MATPEDIRDGLNFTANLPVMNVARFAGAVDLALNGAIAAESDPDKQQELRDTQTAIANLRANDPNFNQAFFVLARSDGFKTANLNTLIGGNENDLMGDAVGHLTSTPFGARAITAGLTTLAADTDITREDAVRAMGSAYNTEVSSIISGAEAAAAAAGNPNAFIEHLRAQDGLLGDHSAAENKAFFDELVAPGNEGQRDAFIQAVSNSQNGSLLTMMSMDAARDPSKAGVLMRVATFDQGDISAGITEGLQDYLPAGAAGDFASGVAASQLLEGTEEYRNRFLTDVLGADDVDWVEVSAVAADGGNLLNSNNQSVKNARGHVMNYAMWLGMNGGFSLQDIVGAWDMMKEDWNGAWQSIIDATDDPTMKGFIAVLRDIIPTMLEGLGLIGGLGIGIAQQVGMGAERNTINAMRQGYYNNVEYTEAEAAEAILLDVKTSFSSFGRQLDDDTKIEFDGGASLSINEIRARMALDESHADHMSFEDLQNLAGAREYATQTTAGGMLKFTMPLAGQNQRAWRGRAEWVDTAEQDQNSDGTPKVDGNGDPVYVQRPVFTPYQGRAAAAAPAPTAPAAAAPAATPATSPATPVSSGITAGEPIGRLVGGGTTLPLNDIFNNLGLTDTDFISVDPDGVSGPEAARNMTVEQFRDNFGDGFWAVDQINYTENVSGQRKTLTTVNALN